MTEDVGAQDMDAVFRALADPSRRRLLDRLNERNGQTLYELVDGLAGEGLAMSRQAVSKHLAILEAAHVITVRRSGREKHHYLDAAPINAIADRWIRHYDRERARALADLKTALENDPMPTTATRPTTENAFVYTSYIRTTPERLWQALTAPQFTKNYWGVTFDTDWSAGSPMTWHFDDATAVTSPDQVVLEAEPFRRLAYTWHDVTPAVAKAVSLTDEQRVRLAAEDRSKVTFEIEQAGEDKVKLTVIHDGFPEDSLFLELVGGGWPSVLSSLKTYLEVDNPELLA